MRQLWSADELGERWTLLPEDLALLADLTDTGKLGLATQLTYWRRHGRFPDDEANLADSMDRDGHRMVGDGVAELTPPWRFPSGAMLLAHGACMPGGGLPVGLSIGHYRLEEDGRTIAPVVIEGRTQQIAMYKAGCAALAGLFAEAVAAATPPAGSA